MNNEQPAKEHFPLSEEIIGMIAETRQQITQLNAQLQGAIILFLRQHKLAGDWRVAENGRELVRPQPQLQPTPE